MPHEQEPYHELNSSLITAYTATFIPRTDVYPLQLGNGRYVSIKRTLYPDLVAAHLKGLITIGAYALDTQSQAKWLCLDSDDELHWKDLLRLSTSLAAQSVPSYLEPSRRGGHLWLFFAPLSGRDTRRLGKQLLADHGITQVEIYPKQDELHAGTGSFVRLPLGRHRLTGRRHHFITLTGEPLAPTIRQQIAVLTQPQCVPLQFIEDALVRAPEAKQVSPTPPFRERKKLRKRRSSTNEQPSERIKAAIGVFEFVSQYVELDSRGCGFCPFHDDEHKSFAVNMDGNYWHCFAGCGGGSVIDFWMRWRKKQGEDDSFAATVADLAQRLLG